MTDVECTRPDCRARFPVLSDRLGKNVPCPSCGQLITARRPPLADAAEGSSTLPLEALLEDVRSLWNVGSMFRTADGAGLRHLHLCGITGIPPRKEIAKTALGAELSVPWSYAVDAVTHARELKRGAIALVALEHTDGSVPLLTAELTDLDPEGRGSIALIVGNEVAGVSRELLDLAPVHVALPMRGAKRSLNVAVAFGVALYTIAQLLDADRR